MWENSYLEGEVEEDYSEIEICAYKARIAKFQNSLKINSRHMDVHHAILCTSCVHQIFYNKNLKVYKRETK